MLRRSSLVECVSVLPGNRCLQNVEICFLRQYVQPWLLKNPKYTFYTIKSSHININLLRESNSDTNNININLLRESNSDINNINVNLLKRSNSDINNVNVNLLRGSNSDINNINVNLLRGSNSNLSTKHRKS